MLCVSLALYANRDIYITGRNGMKAAENAAQTLEERGYMELTVNECRQWQSIYRLLVWMDSHEPRPCLSTYNPIRQTVTIWSTYICQDGRAYDAPETVPATYAAARQVLGY